MTSTNLNCIRKTWSLAALNKMQVALIFYANLFRIAPETEALFKNDLTSQGEKLMDTLPSLWTILTNQKPSSRQHAICAPAEKLRYVLIAAS